MDILYILGRGSKHDDREIRLSLRTVEAYAQNLGRVYIVGNCPDFIQNVVHIPCEDKYHPEQNHFLKVFTACKSDISDNFLLFNDDFYMIRPFDVEKYPYYARGVLERLPGNSHYFQVINHTYDFLTKNGYKVPFNYSVHVPMIYNRAKFMSLETLHDTVLKAPVGYSIRNLYGNFFTKNPVIVPDPKMHTDVLMTSQTGCISSSDKCTHVLAQLEKRFNFKSRWEK